jgi:hypothetical protein
MYKDVVAGKPVPDSVAVHENGKHVKRLATVTSFLLGQAGAMCARHKDRPMRAPALIG